MKITIILPTYNERENIENLIKEIFEVTGKITNHNINILVVDDNSPDGTQNIVKKLQKKQKKLHLITGKKQGLGKAYLRGMKYASENLEAQVMFEMDADFSHDPKEIPNFIKEIDNGFDLVIGSRYIPGGSIPNNWGMHRKFFSIVGNLIVRFALFNFGQKEWTNGYRAIRTNLYKKIRSDLEKFKGYTFQVSFLHKAFLENAKIKEIPIQFVDRVYGESKIGSEYVKNLLLYLIISDIKNPPRILRFLIVGTIGFIVNSLGLLTFQSIGIRASFAAALGAELAIISNFIWNNLWTFSDRKINSWKHVPKKFVIFNLSSLGSVIIQAITIESATRLFGSDPIVIWPSFVVGVLLGLIWNFTMYNKLVWKKIK